MVGSRLDAGIHLGMARLQQQDQPRARRPSSARPLRLAARWLCSRRSPSVSPTVLFLKDDHTTCSSVTRSKLLIFGSARAFRELRQLPCRLARLGGRISRSGHADSCSLRSGEQRSGGFFRIVAVGRGRAARRGGSHSKGARHDCGVVSRSRGGCRPGRGETWANAAAMVSGAQVIRRCSALCQYRSTSAEKWGPICPI